MKIFITDVLVQGCIENMGQMDNLIGRIERLNLNHEECGLVKLEVDYTTDFRCKDCQNYQVDLHFDMDKLIAFLGIDTSGFDEDTFEEELNELYRESDLNSDIWSDIEDIIEKYNKDI